VGVPEYATLLSPCSPPMGNPLKDSLATLLHESFILLNNQKSWLRTEVGFLDSSPWKRDASFLKVLFLNLHLGPCPQSSQNPRVRCYCPSLIDEGQVSL
jgi:hypothetical protein